MTRVRLPIENPLNADEFIIIDQNIEFEEEMTEQKIANIVLGQPEVEDDEGVEKTSDPVVASKEAMKTHLKNLEVDSQIIDNVLKLKREISYRSTQEAKQCRIDEFMGQ